MKGNKPDFVCVTCNQPSVHYCRGMCNPCYQRHLRQRNKTRTAKIQTAKAQTPIQRMKRDDYPYTPPNIGPQYQVDLTAACRAEEPERLVDLVHKNDCIVAEEMAEYLHFCKMVFGDSMAEGDIIKGSCCLEEQALKLLRECNFNISRAKLAILFPIEYRLEPESFDKITEEEIKRRVTQATVDLEEVKEEKREDYSKKLIDALQEKVTKENLEVMVQVARSIKMEVPDEVVEALQAAEVFSTEASAMLEQRLLRPGEVQELAQRSAEFAVITPTIAHIQSLAKNCVEWEAKAEAAMKGRPSTKQLQALASEGTSLQVDLPLLETLRNKYKHTKKWAENLHQLTKQSKFKKDQTKPSLSQIQSLLNEAQMLSFTHCEIPGLESQVETVLSWKERLQMWPYDLHLGRMNIEELSDLMKEYEKLPFQLDHVKCLDTIQDMCDWTIRVEALLTSPDKVPVKQLKSLITEAVNLGVNSPLLTTLEKQFTDSVTWKTQAKQLLKGSDTVSVADLITFKNSGEALKTDLEPFLRQIIAKTEQAVEWKLQCESTLKLPKNQWNLEKIAKLQLEMRNLNLSPDEFEPVFEEISSAETWEKQANSFLSSFPKNYPEITDLDTLNQLISSVPVCLSSSKTAVSLSNLSEFHQNWSTECRFLLSNREFDAKKAQILLEKARNLPVDLGLYTELVDHNSVAEWTSRAEQVLNSKSTLKIAKELIIQAENRKFTANSAYLRLLEAVKMAENLTNRLEFMCENRPKVENLHEIYTESLEIPLEFDAKIYLKSALMNIESFKSRVERVLSEKSSYFQVQCLLFEGKELCCELELMTELRNRVEICEEWKVKAGNVLGSLPVWSSEWKEEVSQPVRHKRGPGEEEVWNSSVTATVHPVEGVVWTLHLPSTRPTSHSDSKRKRIITQRIRELEALDSRRESKRYQEPKSPLLTTCFCQVSDSADSLQCRSCKASFHLACLGLDQKPQSFSCLLCCKRREEQYEHTLPCAHTVTLEELREVISEGAALPLEMSESKALERLYTRGEQWQVSAQSLLSSLQCEEVDLVHMLHDYEGLPFSFPESDQLYKKLRKLDWTQETKVTLTEKANMRTIKRLIKSAGEMDSPGDAETLELVKELENKKNAIEYWSNQLQRLQGEKAGIEELKTLLDDPEVKKLQFDKFESLRKDVLHSESLAAKVREALLNKRSDLATLEKLQLEVSRAKIPHEVFHDLESAVNAIKAWVEAVRQLFEESIPSNEAIKSQLEAYEQIPCTHPLVTLLEEAMSVFCVCRQPDTGEKAMIQCDECKDWFHYDCVGIPKEGPGDTVEYQCPKCAEAKGVEYRFPNKPPA